MSTRVAEIISVIRNYKLTDEELDELARALQQKAERLERFRDFLASIKGSGADVWGMDAQEYINQLRADD